MTILSPRAPLSLILVACLSALRLLCVCPGEIPFRPDKAQHATGHACCVEGAGGAAASTHGPEDHEGTGCGHCGESSLRAAEEVKPPVAKLLSIASPRLLANIMDASATSWAAVHPVRAIPREQASGPPELSVLRQTCILLI